MSAFAGSTSGAGGLSPARTYRWRRSALVSWSTRPTASRTCGDTVMSRPCSSHWYQETPDPGEHGDLLAAQPRRAAAGPAVGQPGLRPG